MMIPNMSAFASLLLVASTSIVSSFQCHPTTSGRNFIRLPNASHMPSSIILHSEDPKKPSGSGDFDEELLVGEQFESSVDWDAEWKKVVANQDQPEKRPGKYKSQVEISAIKTTNKVAKNVFDASKELKSKLPSTPSVPNIRSLQGDGRVS